MAEKMTIERLQTLVAGLNEKVPLINDQHARYTYFDNASSTPTLVPVQDTVKKFSDWYSNVHRGAGFKSQLSSWVFEESRRIIAAFVGADSTSCVIFCKNTTEAINKLAHRFAHIPALNDPEKPVILTTLMEHHSNELPWRKSGTVVHVAVRPDGTVDKDDFLKKIEQYNGKIRLVALTGASNVTGLINPIHDYARIAHSAGARIVVDAAQIAPHRRIDIRKKNDPEHIDFIAFSAHKMYAPYGVGVLVADRSVFECGDPEHVGGGTVDIVNLESAYWKDLPDREEAGTPDIVGVVALAKVIKLIEEVGFDRIIDHETRLTAYALSRLNEIPEIIIYGDRDPANAGDRLGVIALNIKNFDHALTAAVLSYEGGIGVRNGCFCAHPYVTSILGVSAEQSKQNEAAILRRDRSRIPGTVRISFGLYNTKEEIDHLCSMLRKIIKKEYTGKYLLDKERGEYYPENHNVDFSEYFHF